MILVPYYNSRLHQPILDPGSLLQITVTPTYPLSWFLTAIHSSTYLSMILVPNYNSQLHLPIHDPGNLLQFKVTPTYP